MSPALFEKLCEELKTMDTGEMIFIGEGEPFLHPRLFQLVTAAKGAGLKLTLLTNGTLLDEGNVRSLIESRVNILKVSLWAGSRREFEKNHPDTDPQYFTRTVEGMKLLTRTKAACKSALPALVMHQPLNRNNFESIDGMVDLAHETGSNVLSFSPLKPLGGKLASSSLSVDEEKRLSLCLAGAKKRLASLGIDHNIENTLMRYRVGEAVWKKVPCYIGWLNARIKVDGTVIPCEGCAEPVGNLNEGGFATVWNSHAFRSFRARTGTRRGLGEMAESHCDCLFCCYVGDNMRVHRVFRWFRPFRSKNGMRG
jgi:MoaA/NifB/PqqE/SkfB family radical SAM enzyme